MIFSHRLPFGSELKAGFRLFLLFMICFLPVVRIGYAQLALDDKVAEALSIIKGHESSFRGLEISCSIAGAKSFEDWSQGPNRSGASMKVTVGQDEVGTYVNCFLEDLANRSQSEQVMTAGGKHFLATRVNGGPAASVLVDKKCQQNLTETFFFAKPFGGGSVADLRYFSSLLNEPGMTLSTEQAVRNGVPHVVLKGISKLLGEYEFWLTDETEPHLVRAVIRKHGQNEYSPYPGVKQLLSDPLRPDPVVLATLGEAQKNCKSSPIRKSRLYSLV